MSREGGRSVRRRVGAVLLLLAHSTPAVAAEPVTGRLWTLTAEQVSVTGLLYHGVVTTEVDNTPVEVLSFTVGELWATGITVEADRGTGHALTVTAASGHARAAPGTAVELLVLSLAGTVDVLGIGLLPIHLTPDTPPPLVLPAVTLTEVSAVNTDFRGGVLTLEDTRLVTGTE